MPETLDSLDREQMHVEVIFRERIGDEEFVSWFSIQSEAAEPVESSLHEIDKIHLAYWRECIDQAYGQHASVPQVIMIRKKLAATMGWTEPAASAVRWTGQSTWRPGADATNAE
jgi:hypothetical protein